MLEASQRAGRWLLQPVWRVLQSGFGGSLNPLNHLGGLTIYFFWIVLVSGIWLFIFFRTSVEGAFGSVEYLTHQQWYAGGVMRSLHRYASDAAIVTLALHMIREFIHDRYRGKRWFSWMTGVPLLWLVIPLGITGYWLVWDQLAWYVALTSAELLDWLPVFSTSMARNFLSADVLSDRFFTLMAFLHIIGLPLFLVFGIWLHVFRINGPRINPPRPLMAGSLVALLALSLGFPAVSQGEVDMAQVPASLGLDWFYLPVYPLVALWSPGWVWLGIVGFTLLLCALPWLAPMRRKLPAEVHLDFCNGCGRCGEDCPFGAITMMPRSDGKPFASEAVVDPAICVSCGICTGACPTATPFRKQTELVPGIDLPELTAAALREEIIEKSHGLQGDRRVIVFGCRDDPRWRKAAQELSGTHTAALGLVCAGQLPPAFIDFIFSRNLADGIVLAGCIENDCQYRLGSRWTAARLERTRDPRLRKRVDTSRVALAWQERWSGFGKLALIVAAFRNQLPGSNGSGEAAESRPGPRSFVRYALIGIAYTLFVGVVGWLSVYPRFRFIGDGMAMVSLSFSHAGQRVGECRQLSQEELNRLPPNMRRPSECPRERHPLWISLEAGNRLLYQAVVPPTGLWGDGAASVYKRLEIPAGHEILTVGMDDRGKAGDYRYRLEEALKIEPGQHIVIEFDGIEGEFRIRKE